MDDSQPATKPEEARSSSTLRTAGLLLVGEGVFQAVCFFSSLGGVEDLPQRMRAPVQSISVGAAALTAIVGIALSDSWGGGNRGVQVTWADVGRTRPV